MKTKIAMETVMALKNGEHKAFDCVFITYFERVRNFICAIVKAESEAEELAQDIFANLWIKREALDAERSFDSFIYAMARNAAYNYIKHKTVRNVYEAEAEPENMATNPEEILFAKEIELIVGMTVSNMPEKRREIYLLSRKNGLSNEEIATRLAISRKTVENNLSLALKEIRRIISLSILFFI